MGLLCSPGQSRGVLLKSLSWELGLGSLSELFVPALQIASSPSQGGLPCPHKGGLLHENALSIGSSASRRTPRALRVMESNPAASLRHERGVTLGVQLVGSKCRPFLGWTGHRCRDCPAQVYPVPPPAVPSSGWSSRQGRAIGSINDSVKSEVESCTWSPRPVPSLPAVPTLARKGEAAQDWRRLPEHQPALPCWRECVLPVSLCREAPPVPAALRGREVLAAGASAPAHTSPLATVLLAR